MKRYERFNPGDLYASLNVLQHITSGANYVKSQQGFEINPILKILAFM